MGRADPAGGAVLARTTSSGSMTMRPGWAASVGDVAVEPVREGAHRLRPEAVCILVHRRQRHMRVAGLGDVVEADDRHVLGHAQPRLPDDVDEPDGAPVVEGGDRGGPLVAGAEGEERPRGLGPFELGESSGQHDLGQRRRTAHRRAVAAPPLGGTCRATAVEQGDAGVAQAPQVLDGEAQAGGVVGAHDTDLLAGGRAQDAHHRHPYREAGELRRGLGAAEQDDAFAPLGEQGVHRGALRPRASDTAQDELVGRRVRMRVEALEQVAVEGVPDAEGHAERPGPAAAEPAGPGVRAVVELARRREHALPGGVRGARNAAEDDRHEGARDARPLGDVLHRDLR